MTLIISECTIGIWFCPVFFGDMLASLSKEEDKYVFTARTRIYNGSDPSPWSGKDRKVWSSGYILSKDFTEEQAVEKAINTVMSLIEAFGADASEMNSIMMDERGPKGIMEEMSKLDCFHMAREDSSKLPKSYKDSIERLKEELKNK